MTLQNPAFTHLIFADKPAGVTTHSSLDERSRRNPFIDNNDGFAESLSLSLNEKLFVTHRLDRETTGAMVFARDPGTAERLREAFETRSVSKRYLFLTDQDTNQQKITSDKFERESFIERRGNVFVSDQSTTPNSRTQFQRIRSSHGVTLWEARPESGKPHQIRLHAQDAGISILGDRDHGGSEFPALCLHSAELTIAEHTFHSEPPVWFNERALTSDHLLCRWLSAIDRRRRLIQNQMFAGIAVDTDTSSLELRTLRWIHSEGDPLRVEQLGSTFALYWFRDAEPSESEWRSIRKLLDFLGVEKWYLQIRGNRGTSPLEEKVFAEQAPTRWAAKEVDQFFEFRRDSGLSPGLFLDQRRNREWVRSQSSGKSVLNLFCYTGGFSVAAASGGAVKVVSVDVSKTFLEWSKKNFALNSLDTAPHEFRAIDSREYLAWAAKKEIKFDLVICDPPSFSRSKSGLFKIEDEFGPLVQSLFAVTSPGGRILFSTNYEAWDHDSLAARMRKSLPNARIARAPSADWDFELPGNPRNMKSYVVVRD